MLCRSNLSRPHPEERCEATRLEGRSYFADVRPALRAPPLFLLTATTFVGSPAVSLSATAAFANRAATAGLSHPRGFRTSPSRICRRA